MTNFEFIKSLTLEDLCCFLGVNCPPRCDDIDYCVNDCFDCWKRWLNEEKRKID